jgi:hypothetical protein
MSIEEILGPSAEANLRDPLRNFDKNVWGWESILFASRSTRDDGNKRDGRGAM